MPANVVLLLLSVSPQVRRQKTDLLLMRAEKFQASNSKNLSIFLSIFYILRFSLTICMHLSENDDNHLFWRWYIEFQEEKLKVSFELDTPVVFLRNSALAGFVPSLSHVVHGRIRKQWATWQFLYCSKKGDCTLLFYFRPMNHFSKKYAVVLDSCHFFRFSFISSRLSLLFSAKKNSSKSKRWKQTNFWIWILKGKIDIDGKSRQNTEIWK